MKKRLEADLVSIAHKILRLKNKSDVNVLLLETQKLHEKLSVLKFLQDNFDDVNPTIGLAAMEEELEKVFLKNENIPEIVAPETPQNKEDSYIEITTTKATIIEEVAAIATTEIPLLETIAPELELPMFEEEEPSFVAPILEEKKEEKTILPFSDAPEIEKQKTPQVVQISFEELLGGNYADTQFVKVDSTETSKNIPASTAFDLTFDKIESKIEDSEAKSVIDTIINEIETELDDPIKENFTESKYVKIDTAAAAFDLAFDKVETLTEVSEIKPKSLNDKLSKGIAIDLNDRIGFVKHLFNNSSEEYNRVLSQLNSFNNFYETKTFIDEMIKPDYNDWEGKDNYANRFMEIVEKKFL
ncbi:MAG: hypothetical protein ACRC6O_11105 [Flavobacterium sp.]